MSDDDPDGTFSVYLQFDAKNTLIYVGFTGRGMGRQKEHHDTKAWWQQVARTEWLHFQHKKRALAMEEWLIRMFRPKQNMQHNTAPPMSTELAEYAELVKRKRDAGMPLLASEARTLASAEKRSGIRQKCDALLSQLSNAPNQPPTRSPDTDR